MSTTTTKLPTLNGSIIDRWVVLIDGREVGLIEKFKPSEGDLHPYKAYRGIGAASVLIDFIYDEKEAAEKGFALHSSDTKGGFDAAINAVYLAHEEYRFVKARESQQPS